VSTATAESGHEFRLELAEYPKRRGSNMVAGGLLFAGGVAWIAWALTATPDNGADPLPVRLMSLIGLPMIFFG